MMVWIIIRLGFFAEAAHEIDHKADDQNEAKSTAAEHGTTQIKAAATEQKQEHHDEQ